MSGGIPVNYSGIIFDLDGTLLDTLEDLANCMNAVLGRHGLAGHEQEKYKYFVGNGMEMLVRRALTPAHDEENLARICLQELHAEYGRRWNETTKPYTGITALLEALESRGIGMSVLSNKADSFTRLMIDHYFQAKRFQIIYGAREGIPKKPHPGAAQEIARLSGIAPEKYLYLGDTGVDMQTATAAGMYAIGVTWGFREEAELLETGAKTIVHHPLEVLALLEGRAC